jgi:hypothetical protein
MGDGTYDRPCPACGTTGRVTTAAWARWHEEYRRLAAKSDRSARLVALAQHVRHMPSEPEHEPCATCQEIGWIPTELGNELIQFVERHRQRFRARQDTGPTNPLDPTSTQDANSRKNFLHKSLPG